jgi:hypothetical protein
VRTAAYNALTATDVGKRRGVDETRRRSKSELLISKIQALKKEEEIEKRRNE